MADIHEKKDRSVHQAQDSTLTEMYNVLVDILEELKKQTPKV